MPRVAPRPGRHPPGPPRQTEQRRPPATREQHPPATHPNPRPRPAEPGRGPDDRSRTTERARAGRPEAPGAGREHHPPATRPARAPATHPTKRPPTHPVKHPATHPHPHPIEASAADAVTQAQKDMMGTAIDLGASHLALVALGCIGYGENNWNRYTCNTKGYCGVFQLSATLQREHDYRDVVYWTRRAYQDGFYSYGGIKHIAAAHPDYSPGRIANMCQGAYANLTDGENYYKRYTAQAEALVARYEHGNLPTSGPAYHNPLEKASVTAERVDQGVDYAGTGSIVAIADGEVTVASGDGWGKFGAYIEYRITQPGALQGVYIYAAEGVKGTVHPPQKVKAGDVIAHLIPGWKYGIEMGFAAGDGTNHTYSYAHDGPYNEKSSTRPGIAFDNLVISLGGPHGRRYASVTGHFPGFASGGSVPIDTADTHLTVNAGGVQSPTTSATHAAAALDFATPFRDLWSDLAHGSRIGNKHAHNIHELAQAVTYITNKPPKGF